MNSVRKDSGNMQIFRRRIDEYQTISENGEGCQIAQRTKAFEKHESTVGINRQSFFKKMHNKKKKISRNEISSI